MVSRSLGVRWRSSRARRLPRAVGEHLGEQPVPEGLDDGANLVYRHHVAVKLVGSVGQVLLQLVPADLPCQPVPPVDVVPGLHSGTLLGDLASLVRGGESLELAHRDTGAGVQVDGADVLDGPSSLLKQAVDVYARLLFGGHV